MIMGIIKFYKPNDIKLYDGKYLLLIDGVSTRVDNDRLRVYGGIDGNVLPLSLYGKTQELDDGIYGFALTKEELKKWVGFG